MDMVLRVKINFPVGWDFQGPAFAPTAYFQEGENFNQAFSASVGAVFENEILKGLLLVLV